MGLNSIKALSLPASRRFGRRFSIDTNDYIKLRRSDGRPKVCICAFHRKSSQCQDRLGFSLTCSRLAMPTPTAKATGLMTCVWRTPLASMRSHSTLERPTKQLRFKYPKRTLPPLRSDSKSFCPLIMQHRDLGRPRLSLRPSALMPIAQHSSR